MPRRGSTIHTLAAVVGGLLGSLFAALDHVELSAIFLTVGVGVGVVSIDAAERRIPTPLIWTGAAQRCTAHALVLIGGFDHPAHAADAARPTIDELRLAQLTAIDDLTPVGSHHLY